DLKSDLAGLRIERDQPRRMPRWPLYLLLPVVLLLVGFYALRARQAFGAPEVRTVQSVTEASDGTASSGAPVLTASGYVVARRRAVVSAKIQGRLAELRVEEGSHAREGDVIARLESTDYDAQVQRSRAGVSRAEADLAENQRLFRLAKDLSREDVMAR